MASKPLCQAGHSSKVSAKVPNPSARVRVVTKIWDLSDQETQLAGGSSKTVPLIFVNKHNGDTSDGVIVSFEKGDPPNSRRESYLVDYCFEPKEDNQVIFTREVKILVCGVFEGQNATVIASGSRGTGKTHVIQGTNEKEGLATLAIDELLKMAKDSGKSILISMYEVDHEHVFDILDPKRPEVLVFEDRGRKGLSKVPVKSIAEYKSLYLTKCVARKAAQKTATEYPHRCHLGLVVHVVSPIDSSEPIHVGKLNFVDLAGYEDARKKTADNRSIVENNKINMSVYALLNVINALRANESYVPYRDSKLTHMLRDSLGGKSTVLMIACMNQSPDSLYMLNVALRSCQAVHHSDLEFPKNSKCSTRQLAPSSQTPTVKSFSATAKKPKSYQSHLSGSKYVIDTKSAIKGRKLFDQPIHSTKSESKMAHSLMDTVADVENVVVVKCNSNSDSINIVEDDSLPKCDLYPDSSNIVEHNSFLKEIPLQTEDHDVEHTPAASSQALSIAEEEHDIEKENNSLMIKEGASPPISAQLRELSNHMKSLIASTPLSTKVEENNVALYNHMSNDITEPKTPVMEQFARADNRWDVSNVNSPWQKFNIASSGMKNSIVGEYLKFLNSANKEELQKLKGIGEKRATSILQLRENSPDFFKSIDDLKEIGLSAKQIKGIVKMGVTELLN